MSNANWYLLCNTATKRAVDLMQVPEVWRNTTGMLELNEEALSTMDSWSSQKDEIFATPAMARSLGIDGESIDAVLKITAETVSNWIRSMRDPLLAETDKVTVPDRWKNFDIVEKQDIEEFRQALRDIPKQDPFNVVWPAIPEAVRYVRAMDISTIRRPSDSFLRMLREPTWPKSIERIRQDQWLRIHAERERRKAGGVRVMRNGRAYWFWSDEASRAQYGLLEGRANRAKLPPATILDMWKTMSGEFVPLTVELLFEILDNGIVNEGVLFQVAESHRAKMLRADDPYMYNYMTGWPETYSDTAVTI